MSKNLQKLNKGLEWRNNDSNKMITTNFPEKKIGQGFIHDGKAPIYRSIIEDNILKRM